MELPRFQHLIGADVWEHCDHSNTWVHRPTASVRIASREQVDDADQDNEANLVRVSATDFDQWSERRGGAVAYSCVPDLCSESLVLLADPGGHLQLLQGGSWVNLTHELALSQQASSLRFSPGGQGAGGTPFVTPGALAGDPFGRLWLLESGVDRIRLLAHDDLRLLDTLTTPAGSDVVDLALTSWCAVAADCAGKCLWRQRYGGEWKRIDLEDGDALNEYVPVAVAGGSGERAVAIFRPLDPARIGSRLAIVDRRRACHHAIPELEDPLPLILLSDEYLLIGEIERPADVPGIMIFTCFRLYEDGLKKEDDWAVRGFDGRALFLNTQGQPMASTAKGVRPLFPRQVPLVTDGQVETFALDSGTFGCVWHRLFLDICLPAGTSLRVSARAADELPPEFLRHSPRPPAGRGRSTPTPIDDWEGFPLGSRSRDDGEGWIPLPALDRRAYRIDIPFPPGSSELPSQDEYRQDRAKEPDPLRLETLEGLLSTPPGRYLWLRIELFGTTRRSPALVGVRASYPRPSILEHLPAFWRGEPQAAQRMDLALSLFEGLYTEIDQRIESLPHMLDARICPPDAIEWLAGFVALSFDSRVKEGVRRQLLSEMTELYRKRGTLPGLTRLCEILAQCEVKIVEGFRVRRRDGAVLAASRRGGRPDVARAVLGPGLQLGGDEGALKDSPGEVWEAELLAKHGQLLQDRLARRAEGDALCPAADLPLPIGGIAYRRPVDESSETAPPDLIRDPVIAFYRRYAHRFSVLLFRDRDPDVEALVQEAIEGAKPAHTLHELCWLEAGFRPGSNSYVGIGTRMAGSAQFHPTVLGRTPLGTAGTLALARPSASLGTFVGTAKLGSNTHLG